MGTNMDNVLDDLETAIAHIQYFAEIKGFEIDEDQLDSFVNNLINLVTTINGSK